MAYLDPDLYREFYNISKEQMGNNTLSKWEDYNLIIDKKILEKLEQFVPIDNYNGTKNNKGFRTTKNGRDTGIFKKINNHDDVNDNINQINTNNIENNYIRNKLDLSQQNNPQNIQKLPINRINIIPKNKIDIDDEDK